MRLEDFDYTLPPELVAQKPVFPRDRSKLMILDRETGKILHRRFFDLPDFVDDRYVFVFNNTKVIPARLQIHKSTGGKLEVLFLRELRPRLWEVLAKGKIREGTQGEGQGVKVKFIQFEEKQKVWKVKVSCPRKVLLDLLEEKGKTPLPPYIKAKIPESKARQWYQSIFAQKVGSVAAPTASFHFTERILKQLRKKGVDFAFVTLHVGWGTFAPIRTQDIARHSLHSEWIEVSPEAANFLNQKVKEGKKILAVGTTVTRTLESVSTQKGLLKPFRGETDLYIYPPYKFKIVRALITNFHLPKSSLLVLVSAFAGKERVLRAYREAIRKKYRFFSFGDAMLIR